MNITVYDILDWIRENDLEEMFCENFEIDRDHFIKLLKEAEDEVYEG